MLKHILKTTLGLIALSGLLFAGCKNNPTGSKSSASAPTITVPETSMTVADGADTTITIKVQAPGDIKSITASASSGTVTVSGITGVGTTSGSAKVEYKAPTTNGSYSFTIAVMDKDNQTATSKVGVTVSASVPMVFNNGDQISGTWPTGATVEIKGYVTVPQGKTLIVDPGVTVVVYGDGTAQAPDITVMGSLYCYGTKSQPIMFTVPKAQRTASNMFAGLWGGILGTSTSPAMVFKYTTVEYVGAPAGANDPIVQSGELNEGDPRYGLFYDNVNGVFIFEHSKLAYTIDDGIRERGGKMIVAYDTFSQTGTTGGESINIKSGVTGILAYNLCFESSTNGLKWSNSGNTNVQTDVDCYNNTLINCGWRRVKTGRGGSINIEVGGRGKIYNNLIVDCKYGVRLVPPPNQPDTANVSVGYDYMYGTTQGEVNEFYPTNGTLIPGEYETSNDIAGSPGQNNPMFVNFDVTQYDSTEAVNTHPQMSSSWDFHLQSTSPALNKGKTGWTPVLSSPITVGDSTYAIPAPSNFIGAFGTN